MLTKKQFLNILLIIYFRIVERYSGTRSKLWSSLSEMTYEARSNYLSRLVADWPNKWERRALTLPIHGNIISTILSTTFIGMLYTYDF